LSLITLCGLAIVHSASTYLNTAGLYLVEHCNTGQFKGHLHN